MKANLFYSVLLLVVVFAVSSCKKDEQSLKSPELLLEGNYDGMTSLNLAQKTLKISGKIAPESAVNNKISIKVTTNEDPVGFEFIADLTDGDVVDGKIKYLYKSFSTTISAANHTDAAAKYIKVASTTDNIKIVVGNGLY